MAPLYDMSIAVYIRALENQRTFLKKGEQWCKDNGHDTSKLIDGKLYEDMKPLPFQVQSASNSAKMTAVRVAGVENSEVWEDNESSFEELYARIEKTIEFLKKSVKPESFAGKEGAEVIMKAGGTEYKFTGLSYLQTFALPNFFFHHQTAYAILRNAGVPIGKLDYLGAADWVTKSS